MKFSKKYESAKRRSISVGALLCLTAASLFSQAPLVNDVSTPPEETAAVAPSNENTTNAVQQPVVPSARSLRALPSGASIKLDQNQKNKSWLNVGPGVLPPDVRLNPFLIDQYGAAPAIVQLRFGAK